jgi:cardiolipin synthase
MISVGWHEVVFALYVAWVIGASAALLMSRRSPTATLAWMFAFATLPVASGIFYLVFGPRRLRRRRALYGIARGLLASDVSKHLRSSCSPTRPPLTPDAAGLASVVERLGQGAPTFAIAAALLDDGDAKFEALEDAIVKSTHHVHLEYYIWEDDDVGRHFRDLLVEARRRGVAVRVLYDAVGSPGVRRSFWAPLTGAGGEVLAFNPVGIMLGSIRLANFRTHRKIVVCDGGIGFLGGINLHNPESATRSSRNAWRDAHVRIEGEPVRRLQRLMLENWMYAGGAFTLTPESLSRYFPPAHTAQGEGVQIIASGPDDESASLHAFYLAAISSARHRIWIETPYLIPDEPLEAALGIAVLRGVQVEVIVPREADSRLVNAASHTYCESLARAGVAVREYGPPMLHAKTMVVDDTVALVGTANFDNRSFRLNFEVAAAFYGGESVARLARRFDEDRAVSHPFPRLRRGPRITACLESIARLASPIL